MRRSSHGVATYLQTFILIGVAIGGSFAVSRALGAYSSRGLGPGILLSGGSIRQGAAAALEALTITNTGESAMSTATVMTNGVPSTASYCYTVMNPVSSAVVAATCPTMAQNPSSIQFGISLAAGSSVVFQVTIQGSSVFTPGVAYAVVVVGSNGEESPVSLVAEQA